MISDPLINTMVKWWFRLVVVGSISAFLGLVTFIQFEVSAGTMSQGAYVYLGVVGY
jgi:hypothetical protein